MPMETAKTDKEKERDAIGIFVFYTKLWLLKRKNCILNTEFGGNFSLHGAFTGLLSKKHLIKWQLCFGRLDCL